MSVIVCRMWKTAAAFIIKYSTQYGRYHMLCCGSLFCDSNDPARQTSTGITGCLTLLVASASEIILTDVHLHQHIIQ